MIMRLFSVAVVLIALVVAPRPALPQPAPHAAEHHEFVINNFHTESGVVLPNARVVYGTYGKLNAARDNAVLLPSHYMANHHGYDWLIVGQGAASQANESRALDPSTLFLIATE